MTQVGLNDDLRRFLAVQEPQNPKSTTQNPQSTTQKPESTTLTPSAAVVLKVVERIGDKRLTGEAARQAIKFISRP
jgi:hypothetical protein